ncbi:MAG: hypothetical protein ACTTJH_03080 [Bacteroidales bacterium]
MGIRQALSTKSSDGKVRELNIRLKIAAKTFSNDDNIIIKTIY